MKQIAQYQDGRIELQEVPAPQAPPGGILVRVTHSVISPGTEKMKVEQAKMNLLQKAKARPDQVKKVLDTARTLGWRNALEKVKNRLESPTPLGYSAAGEVIAVDEGNTRFRVGDRVAVGGAECAHHAEVVAIPDLLAAPVPDGVENWQAAYTTLCSISMQAVRQSGAGLGDRVLVMGQGLVGLLATAILEAAGARVMAVDLDAARLAVAKEMGAERCVNARESDLGDAVRDWTGGFGADAALICAGGRSNTPVEQGVSALRDRGTMVIVGILDAQLDWKTFYGKEIEVRYSRSYGPGRYEPSYEWGGVDYPIGYVRWSENRNFEACLALVAQGKLNLAAVTTKRAHFAESVQVYDELMRDPGQIGVVLEYGKGAVTAEIGTQGGSFAAPPGSPEGAGRIARPADGLDAIGAGNFVRTMLLPHLKGAIPLGTVVNNTSLSARHVKEKFGFAEADTEAGRVLARSAGRAVMIGTRHHLHASMVLDGLVAGAHVFVEKPLCLFEEQLRKIDAAMAATKGSVMVGFNRRFAPAAAELKRALDAAPGPKSLSYHVFAGELKPDHWYANYDESGGRVLGEACHFFDFLCYILGSKPVRVVAQTTGKPGGRLAFPDSVAAQVEFEDGSSGQLVYTAEGDYAFPKETVTAFGMGVVGTVENFQRLDIYRGRRKQTQRFGSKGHAEEMATWVNFLNGGAEHPLPYAQSRQSMALTFAALRSIRERRSVSI
ncbi:MAG: bi-domain-containing oxidoreductase [Verrucomicrobiales bacterium]